MKKVLYLLAFIFVFTSCEKEVVEPNPTTVSAVPNPNPNPSGYLNYSDSLTINTVIQRFELLLETSLSNRYRFSATSSYTNNYL